MAIKQLNPYLNFDGTAEKAIQLYEKALGAKTETIQRFGDVPGGKPEHKSRVMHALLKIGDSGVLMISDTRPEEAPKRGDAIHVCLDFDDAAQMAGSFEMLSAGGKVTMPLQDTFWGARFGIVVDPYGVSWMFNHNLRKT
jgi:PhnB protein